MEIKELQQHWDAFGKSDPLWAVLTSPDKKGNKWDADEFFAHGRQEIDDIMRHLDSLKLTLIRRRALDFGCGAGRLTQALARYFERVDGVDIAPSMIAAANSYNRFGEACRFQLNETDDLRLFPAQAFDFVYSCITLQHMQPKYARKYIMEFLRVLTPAGVLVFQLPSHPILFRAPWKPHFRGMVLRFTPRRLLDATYRKVKYHNQPRMEGYWITRNKMVEFLQRQGARIVDITQDRRDILVDCRYCVARG
jgi:SAM-dependent methyltransferase